MLYKVQLRLFLVIPFQGNFTLGSKLDVHKYFFNLENNFAS